MVPHRSLANAARLHSWMHLRRADSSLPTISCGTPAIQRLSSARDAHGSHPRYTSCHIFILAMSPSPFSAKDLTKRANGTATSWVGKYLGTRPRTHSTLSWLDVG